MWFPAQNKVLGCKGNNCAEFVIPFGQQSLLKRENTQIPWLKSKMIALCSNGKIRIDAIGLLSERIAIVLILKFKVSVVVC